MALAVGAPLPAFSLQAAVSAVRIDNAWFTGRRAVIVVHGPKSADAAKQVSKALRTREPDASKVAFASIVDLRAFAGIWKKVAQAQLKASYTKLAEKATAAGLKPEEQVIICPDWDGAVAAAFGVADPDKEPHAIVIGQDGRVLQRRCGAELAIAVDDVLAS
ncbi:MAG: hypothetical protein V4510_11105 [bacterium]